LMITAVIAIIAENGARAPAAKVPFGPLARGKAYLRRSFFKA